MRAPWFALTFAKPLEKRSGYEYFKWIVFVDESDEVLSQIKEVEYTLHPTFLEPHQCRDKREDKFSLESTSWGEFTMLIAAKYRDDRVETVPYRLDLSRQWPNDN